MRTFIGRISEVVDKIVRVATVVLAAGFTLLIFTSVMTRYVFNHPIMFSQEVSKLLFIWSAFLSATIAFRKHQHIRFEFLNSLLGNKGKVITDLILYIACLIFFLLIFYYSIQWTRIIWGTYLPVLELSQGWLYVSVIVSSFIFFVHSVELLFQTLEAFRHLGRAEDSQ